MPIAIQSSDGSGSGPTIRDIDGSANEFIYTLNRLVFSGAYPTGGDTLDLTPLVAAGVPTGALPLNGTITSNGGGSSTGVAGGAYNLQLGTLLTNNKVKVFTAGVTELNGNYTAVQTGDVVTLLISWRKFA